MNIKPVASPTMSQPLIDALEEHVENLKNQIQHRASDFAKSSTTQEDEIPAVDISMLSKAINEVAKGQATPSEHKLHFFDLFPPFTCVCAVLCLAFAILGILGPDTGRIAAQSSGFLDIAKIFAGAIVGSTTSVALSSAKSKQPR